MRRCLDCKIDKSESDFPKNGGRKNLHPYCLPCHNARSRKYYRNNREEILSRRDRPELCMAQKERRRKEPMKHRIFHWNAYLGTNLTMDIVKEILEKQGWRCVFCGDPLMIDGKIELDHKIPRSRGGSKGELSNLQFLCWTCNQTKDRLTPDEYVNHCNKVLENWNVTFLEASFTRA